MSTDALDENVTGASSAAAASEQQEERGEGGANNRPNNSGEKSARKKSGMTSAVKAGRSLSTSKSAAAAAAAAFGDSSGEEEGSDLELSDTERHFLTKGAFLLTPSNELTLEKAEAIVDKMNFRAPFSLTKTATGILFKFAEPDDCAAVYKKGFHKVTGARFYKKIVIPCRPMRTYVVYALDVPDSIPVEDIRHALFKLQSVVEVSRVVSSTHSTSAPTLGSSSTSLSTPVGGVGAASSADKSGPSTPLIQVSAAATATNNAVAGYCPLVRITLGSQEEANALLQNGLDFFGATFFPTEAARPMKKTSVCGKAGVSGGFYPGSVLSETFGAFGSNNGMMGTRIRELVPVFDASGFAKIAAPAERTVKPRN
ncbi:uncharacterized protein LOC132195991 isoform X2 [Neocloeon triangulifer]|uniref:uncharacterized protein LOC132195991 isoform X2 n=1 Tax=Neocloeon triangulifer TaxID=2078957 RepID=UPI00286F56A2|nr:uncharacterized protein LOC132195991 isoform X2 [Neocloeon triangulifer]